MIRNMPEFAVNRVYRWADWPDRERLTRLPPADVGIDLVAMTDNGKIIAIQCKCYEEEYTIQREDINSFLAVSGSPFDMRWVVATCRWGKNAESIIQRIEPPAKRIDFHEYDSVHLSDKKFRRERRNPFPLQVKAVESVVTRLSKEGRGQLVMACGTGKTYTSLLIAERLVPANGGNCSRILFLAPSIALVSQTRREWLRYTSRPLNGMVVCSDHTSGGRGEDSDDIRISELECEVTTDPKDIAGCMGDDMDGISVVFCTYQSLKQVSKAQSEYGAPDFDLIIADEAHRTTGIEKDNGFHMVHNNNLVRGDKRLYMTATPRVYTAKSKRMMESRGHDVYDMEDYEKFGEVLYRLTFKEAVEAGMLSDYRVSIMMMHDDKVVRDLYDKYLLLVTDDDSERVIKYEDVERLLGTALAINGITGRRGGGEKLPRVLGFANSRVRSRAFRDLLNMPDLHKILASRMSDDSLTMHKVEHVDGSSSAYERNTALRNLGNANEDDPRMLCNVKLFTEGVDVPSLMAVAFLDPRDSMVDVVQAVGRVMRKAEGKKYGHIIIPVPVRGNNGIAEELEAKDEWRATGRVLRALQSHDGRLPENPAQFIDIVDPFGGGVDTSAPTIEGIQDKLQFEEISEKFYAKVVANSGLARPGQMVTDEIEWVVGGAGRVFAKSADLDEKLAAVLGLQIGHEEYTSSDICKIASLLVINACLLHRRLQDKMDGLARLGDIGGSNDPRTALIKSWRKILEKDYAPVFEPALRIVEALPVADKPVKNVLYRIIDRANAMADSLSELGYDHAGPLYHKILGTAQSDSANYTHNVSALMLARLAFSDEFVDWNDINKIIKLRIMDPACGTGTLLMAALKTVKDRMNYGALDDHARVELHRKLVEDVICGLDINRHAVQLAACNLTLGASTTDYKNMNLYTMKHGPQSKSGGIVKAGTVEVLRAANDRDKLKAFVQPLRGISDLQAKHVDEAKPTKEFPLHGLDMVIMNPPFGNNEKRNHKFPSDVVKQMQRNEIAIQVELKRMDKEAGGTINSNSISTFFTPLADRLLDTERGTLAKVLPVTASTGASGLPERMFLASRFRVERIITSHDPKRINFSYKTGIHESLMVCRRHGGSSVKPPSEFISLYKMPENTREAVEVADAITHGGAEIEKWGSVVQWPTERVEAGDWSPVQWCNNTMADTIHKLETSPLLERIDSRYVIGPDGRAIRGCYEVGEQDKPDAVKMFYSISSTLRRTIRGVPESWRVPKKGKAKTARKYWARRANLFVASKFDTISGRLTALYSDEPSLGSWWFPVQVCDGHIAKALAVWWNSTPVRMMSLNRRSKKMTYPQWSLEHQKEIRIPKPKNPGWQALRDAYDRVCDMELLALKHATEDPARVIIDEAAARALDIDPKIIAGWREKLALEPTISNKRVE